MTTHEQLTQQESTVKMLEQLVKVRRASQADLDEARAKLAGMRGAKPKVAQPTPTFSPGGSRILPVDREREYLLPVEVLRPMPGADVKTYTAGISREIDQLQRQMAELSNQLHTVPPHVDCPELTRPIVKMKRQIEALWTKRRHAERNGVPAPEQEAEATEQADPADELRLLQLEQDRQKLREKRSKLRKKLDDPRRSTANDARWRVEAAKVQHELDELDAQITILRA